VSALEAGTAAAGVDPADAELLVAVVAKRIKVAELVVRTPLVGLKRADRSFRLATAGRRPLALRAPYGGCDIEVSLVLNRQLPRSSTRPWRKGTWLGQVTYSVRTELVSTGFSPIPLTPELRSALSLPYNVWRYVETEDPLEPADVEHGVRLYVDESILTSLAARPNTPGAKTVQRQLFVDVVSAVVGEASRRLNDSVTLGDRDLGETLLGTLVDVACKHGEPTREGAQGYWLQMIATSPSRFIANLESWVGAGASVADLKRAIEGDL
jgi:hypothetical protein